MREREMGMGRSIRPAGLAAGGCGTRVFNEEDFLRNLGGDRDLVRTIVTMFLDDAPSGMECLKEAVDRNDAAEMRRLAHKMKGAAANIRAEALAHIEDNGSRRDMTGAASLFEATRRELERFRDLFTEKTDRARDDERGDAGPGNISG